MRDPRQYTRSLIICQSTVTITYLVIGVVVYYFCGSFVASPALGSAGITMKKVCYGLALPGLIVTVTIISHVRAPRKPHNPHPRLTFLPAPRQVHLHPPPPGLPPPHEQLLHPLGRLAKLHRRLYSDIVRHRQRHPCFRRACVAHWSPAGHSHVFPADGLHVAARQLAESEEWEGVEVEVDGGLEYFCDSHWDFLDDWRDLRVGCGNHAGV